jgi:tetratricopeptide (TPR) repeat protein
MKQMLIGVLVSGLAYFPSTYAEPFVPQSDAQVIERLPYKAADPEVMRLHDAALRLRRDPENLRVAVRLARGYLELGRASGDPRYAGYAQAALMPWWDRARPPQEVLLLRATLHQRVHEFDAALADLATLLAGNPFNAQARLTRATVLQVQGHYGEARTECLALSRLADELISTACLASVESVSGKLHESYHRLRGALDRRGDVEPTVRSWVLTGLAEMAARAGLASQAETHFRDALALDSGDFYLLGAHADFLLDQGRPLEVIDLLRDRTSADPLLLRYALALKAAGSRDLPAQTQQLTARFEASRMRGDRVHLREEARFALHILSDARDAVRLAKQNWAVQREVADVRILLEAALASGDVEALASVEAWLAETHLEDVHLHRQLPSAVHPL